MSDLFVKFPDSPGNYADTPGTNLLVDADTAHLQQSVGKWKVSLGFTAPALSTDLPPVFGDTHLVVVGTVDGTGSLETADGVDGTPVAASTEYTFAASAGTDQAGTTVNNLLFQYRSDGSYIGLTTIDSSLPVTVDDWGVISASFTTGADTAFVMFRLNFANVVDGRYYVDAVSVREGTDPTFIPSLKVVGDLDLQAKLAVVNPTATNGLLGHNLDPDDKHFVWWATKIGGQSRFVASLDGATDTVDVQSGVLPISGGVGYVQRVTRDASTGDVVFYVDGGIVSTVGDVSGALFPGSTVLGVGYSWANTFNLLNGDIYWAEVRDGIGGPVVARFDAVDVP